ncbi:hypothetical protein SLEP1_g54478 [Rubroshorea leprosula]|uniref:1,3-beta-glucan synthase component FKS1-like domain-containing protein n=1 Tax=Rubroshorea leprosula TaxID=152421 RepID=A0AAV5MCI3_9ROSI|nr:hypothetical protein SLEP1_g54478 [Rubroshorea leprosula]
MPECICYIYNHMAMELNKILDNRIDDYTGMPFVPSSSGDCGFLKNIMMLFYETIRKEVEDSQNRTASHFAWRNYDDINEYFLSKRCFKSLKWPIDMRSNFLYTANKNNRVGKMGFVD